MAVWCGWREALVVEVAFYGDDFTGSTDALLQFERCGLRGVLLVDLPPIDELRDLATRYDVIGVAGIARSLAPDEQEAEIRPILTALRDLNPRVVQYKICSTADSSPQLGSIGRALEVGRSVFGPTVVPVLAAQPELGRYTVFSHHFAAEAGSIHRLDRQPTMATHPATPMTESDLRLHLANQTTLRVAALHLTSYADLPAPYTQSTADAVILDALTDADLRLLGQTLIAASNNRPLFTIGSGGLSRALALNLPPSPQPTTPPTSTPNVARARHTPLPAPPTTPSPATPPPSPPPHRTTTLTPPTHDNTLPAPPTPSPATPPTSTPNVARTPPAPTGLSPTTPPPSPDRTTTPTPPGRTATPTSPGQPTATPTGPSTPTPPTPGTVTPPPAPWDAAPGSAQVLVVSGSQSTRTREQIEYAVRAGWLSLELQDPATVQRAAVAALHDGAPGVVVHTGERTGQPTHNLVSSLGKALAEVARTVVENTDVRRVVVAGGDTSGRIVRHLGITALELLPAPNHPTPTDLGPGTALCRVVSQDATVNGLQVLLKGGQIGTPDLFESFRTQGDPATSPPSSPTRPGAPDPA